MIRIGFTAVTNGGVLIVREDDDTLMWGVSTADLERLRRQIDDTLANPCRCETIEQFAEMAAIPTWTSET